MKWLTTFSLVIRSNINTLCERFENPELVLNQLIIDMEEELERVRANVAGVIADEILLGKKVDRAREETRQWQERAETALRRKDEGGARAALEQKVLAEQRGRDLDKEYSKHKDETAKLHRAVRDLEHKIRQANQRPSLLMARLARANSSRTINDVLNWTESQSAVAQFQRLEARVDRAEAMEQAYDRLADRDPKAQELERQFEERERKERLQKEFDDLKRRVQGDE